MSQNLSLTMKDVLIMAQSRVKTQTRRGSEKPLNKLVNEVKLTAMAAASHSSQLNDT